MRLLLNVVIACAAALGPAKAASPDPRKTGELLAIVQSRAELAERARALQQLAPIATAEAVPALTALLADDKLGQYARDVLEVMPDPAAARGLREALPRLAGRAQIGVINSLGVKRDIAAVDPLRRLAATAPPEVAGPALLALGRIGTPEALQAIMPPIGQGAAQTRAAAAEAALIIADRLARGGDESGALRLYEAVRTAALPLPLRVAATRGVIARSGNRGVALAIEQLHTKEVAFQDVALLALRELRDPQVGPALVAELDRFEPGMRALVLGVLMDRREPGTLDAIEARAKSETGEVRLAALRALGAMGGASSLPILLDVARATDHPESSDTAWGSLARIPAAEADAFLLRALDGADTAFRGRLIGILGERKVEAATPELLRLAGSADLDVAKAALRSLGLVAKPSDLPRLIALSIALGDEAARTLADRAIVTTSMKILQPERRAEPVLTAFRREPAPAVKSALARPLGVIVRSMGGNHDVFFALKAALGDPSPRVREAVVKVLSDWPDATPSTVLLDIAADAKASEVEREMALRGAIRMAANVAAGRERSPLNVVAAYERANRLVRSDAGKLMIVSALGELKRPEAAAMLEPYLADPAVRAEAALAAVQIAPALVSAKQTSVIQPMLEKIAASEKDDVIRQKAARLARGVAPQPAKEKGKGKKAAAAAPVNAGRLPFYNGTDLAGWEGDPGVWRVRDGVIVGGSLEGNPRNEFLATTRRHRDFVLRLEYRLVGTDGFVNGGVQFRSVRIAQPPNEMSGYQADIGAGHSGSLYDESRRRKFLARASEEQIKRLEKPGDWNRYEIRCEGAKVELSLNGEKTITFVEEDASVARDGVIALQIHGNCKAEIAFRNLDLIELP